MRRQESRFIWDKGEARVRIQNPERKVVIKLYLLDYSVVKKQDKTYRIITVFDPNSKRKVVTKFLSAKVEVPEGVLVTPDDLKDVREIDVKTDLTGDVLEISPM